MTLSLNSSGLTKSIWYSPGWAQQAHAQTRHGCKSKVTMATKMKKDLVICQLCSLTWFFEITCGKQRDALCTSYPLQPFLHSLRSVASLTIAAITAFSEALSLV